MFEVLILYNIEWITKLYLLDMLSAKFLPATFATTAT